MKRKQQQCCNPKYWYKQPKDTCLPDVKSNPEEYYDNMIPERPEGWRVLERNFRAGGGYDLAVACQQLADALEKYGAPLLGCEYGCGENRLQTWVLTFYYGRLWQKPIPLEAFDD